MGGAFEARISHLALENEEVSQGAIRVFGSAQRCQNLHGWTVARFGPLLWEVADLCTALFGRDATRSHHGRGSATVGRALQRAAELQMCQGRAYAKVPVEYWRCDVLAHDFVQSLARRVEGMGRPAAILAMHLCGRLSLQAISAFRQINLIRCCVLGPCCLPHSSDAPKELQDVYGIGMSDEEQFDAWAVHLEKLLRRIPGVSVTRKIETGILSSRRLLLTAVKAESCSST